MSIQRIYRQKFLFKLVVSYLILAHVFQIVFPTAVFALGTGAASPEFSTFTPFGVSEMVDVSSGDFSYNIPLLDVGGYPVNLSYQGGYGMDDEAGATGLGWNLNIGQLNRQMRGLPDEFDGKNVLKEFNRKPNTTIGLNLGLAWEFAGIEMDEVKGLVDLFKRNGGGLSISAGIFHNNYKGIGFELGISPELKIMQKSGYPSTVGLGLNFNNTEGISLQPSFGLGYALQNEEEQNTDQKVETKAVNSKEIGNIGFNYNSRSGIKGLTLSIATPEGKDASKGFSGAVWRTLARGTTISFSSPPYTPPSTMPFTSLGATFDTKLGIELFGSHPDLKIGAYISSQFLKTKREEIPAYGYMNLHNSKPRSLMDFNREKDGPFYPNASHNLPVPNSTYDLYTASGQGVAGMFRPRRNDWGIVADPYVQSGDFGAGVDSEITNDTDDKTYNDSDPDNSYAFEFGAASGVHFGGNLSFNISKSRNGRWFNENKLAENFRFLGADPANPKYEPYYFKNIGELTAESDNAYYNSIGGDKPVYVDISLAQRAKDQFKGEDHQPINVSNKVYHRDYNTRARRNQHMSFMTAEEAIDFADDPKIRDYMLMDVDQPSTWNKWDRWEPETRINEYRSASDPSIFTVLNPGGMRYEYGIPAYNTKQRDVTFNIAGFDENTDYECTNNLVAYNPSGEHADNSIANDNGIDHYFEATELPAFPHTHLLTKVMSPDYVDVTNNGITSDDPGSAYRIQYSLVHKSTGWRTPLNVDPQDDPTDNIPPRPMANFNGGMKTKTNDDKASYTYGEKEYWLTQSIWSKSHVAFFFYADREDGLGVQDEDGTLKTDAPKKKLKEIRLYARSNIEQSGTNDLTQITPLKTVVFTYDYSLCQGLPNSINGGGKLTLKSLYFTYRDSEQGAHNPYEFVYSDINPNYESRAQDRWGKYMPNDCDPNALKSWEFPYVDQSKIPSGNAWYDPSNSDRRLSDVYAEAWQIKEIKTPTGATIKLEYEADDYAYVQHKKAMQMVKVEGAGLTNNYSQKKSYFFERNGMRYDQFHYLFLDLPTASQNDQEFLETYIGDIEDMYINFNMDINGKDKYEYVGGFVEIYRDETTGEPEAGLVSQTGGTKAWIRLNPARKKVENDESRLLKYPAVSRLSWEYARMHFPELVYPGSDFKNTDDNALDVLAGFVFDVAKVFGYYKMVRSRKFGKFFKPEKSWVRLHNPDGYKHGGGLRVKRIQFSDRWDQMGGGVEGTFGMEYDYNLRDAEGNVLGSSGVAAWEPMLGGEENPFRMPAYFRINNLANKDDVYTLMEPFGETFYPAPRIVYSQVKVRPLTADGVVKHASGYTVYEYYTAKEYPVYTKFTELKTRNPIPNWIPFGEKIVAQTATQGYAIYLNSMHGTPKSRKDYSESGVLVGGSESIYRDKSLTTVCSDCRELDNENVKTINPNGSVNEFTVLGREIDFTVASREQFSSISTIRLSGNVDAFPVVFPIILLSMFGLGSEQNNRFRSMVTAKVIHRSPLLKEVRAFQGNATVSTFNDAWDAETGDVILSHVVNEFNDPIYQWNDPAYRAYERMGPAYQNQGISLANVKLDNLSSTQLGYFSQGDEVLIDGQKAWVLDITSNELVLVDEDGILLPTELANGDPYSSVKIIRSGNRNLQDASVGSTVLKDDPLAAGNTATPNFTSVISANATEYSDRWQLFCGVPTIEERCEGCNDASAEARNLMTLLTIIAQTRGLTPGIVSLDNHPYFTYLLKEAIFDDPKNLCAPELHITTVSQTNNCTQQLLFKIGDNCNGVFDERCSITLNADPSNNLCLEFLDQLNNITAVVPDPTSCDESNDFTVEGVITYCDGAGGQDDIIPLSGTISCFPVRDCETRPYTIANCAEPGQIVNPFTHGIWGNWRSKKSYTFLGSRTVDISNSLTDPTPLMDLDISQQGEIHNYQTYWDWTQGKLVASTDPTVLSRWQWAEEAQKVIPQGPPVQNVNALGIFSSAIYGYNLELPIAVAANSRNTDIANANFEVEEDVAGHCYVHNQFQSDGGSSATLSTQYAHTGYQSMKILNNPGQTGEALVSCALRTGDCQTEADDLTNGYKVKDCDCVGVFMPEREKVYRMSFWIRSDEFAQQDKVEDYTNWQLVIDVDGGTMVSFDNVQRSPIIDGWQQITGSFVIPVGTVNASNTMEIRLANVNPSQSLYLDDFRVYPVNGTMESYVYDPGNRRLLAQMDINGYATYYQYSEQGDLTSIKRETTDGIQTLQEGRQHIMVTQ